MNRAEHLLGHAPLFQGADLGHLRLLAALGSFRSLRRGATLFREGDPLETLYLVESGGVRVFRLARGGARELTLHVEGPRQVVAGLALFQGPVPSPVSAAALHTGAEVLALPAAAVRAVVFDTPSLAASVLAHFSRRQTDLLAHMERLVFGEVGERLAAYLLEHAGKGPHPLPTNSELAALLGTVPELVSRKLGEFYRLGLIGLERRTVRVLNAVELARLARGPEAP